MEKKEIMERLAEEGIPEMLDQTINIVDDTLDGGMDMKKLELEMKCTAYFVETAHQHVEKQVQNGNKVRTAVESGYAIFDANQTDADKHVEKMMTEVRTKKELYDRYSHQESDVLVDEELPPDTEKHNELMQGLSDRQDAADRQCESYDDLCVKTEEDLAKWSDYIKLVVEVREKESELAALQKEDDDLTANIDTMMCEKEKREAEMERVNALLAQRTEELKEARALNETMRKELEDLDKEQQLEADKATAEQSDQGKKQQSDVGKATVEQSDRGKKQQEDKTTGEDETYWDLF